MQTETNTKIVERHLACILTDEERAALGRMAARAVKDYGTLEAQKKEATADFSARLKEKSLEINDLSEKVDTGVEWRQVECHVLMDPYLGRVKVTRADTGEVIEERAMLPGEAQTRMDV